MKIYILAAALLCLTPLMSNAQALNPKSETADYGTKVKVGGTAPDFVVEMIGAPKIKLSDLKGKTVLLNFWATWCPPCRAELARVQKDIIDRFAGKNFIFLPISRGETKEQVSAFLKKNGYGFAAGLDPDESIFKLYAEKAIPRSFIIGADGKIKSVEIGYSEELFAELIGKLDDMLKVK